MKDTRLQQIQAAFDDARTLAADIEEELAAADPATVDLLRIRRHASEGIVITKRLADS